MNADKTILVGNQIIQVLRSNGLNVQESLEVLGRVAAPIIQDAIPRHPIERRINAVTKYAEYVAALVAHDPDNQSN